MRTKPLMSITMGEDRLVNFLMDMLCLSGLWEYFTSANILRIRFNGNPHNVQKRIYDWLSVPERKENFEMLNTIRKENKNG